MTKPSAVITIITAGLINFAPVITKTAGVIIKTDEGITKLGEGITKLSAVIAKIAEIFARNGEVVNSLIGIATKLTEKLAKQN